MQEAKQRRRQRRLAWLVRLLFDDEFVLAFVATTTGETYVDKQCRVTAVRQQRIQKFLFVRRHTSREDDELVAAPRPRLPSRLGSCAISIRPRWLVVVVDQQQMVKDVAERRIRRRRVAALVWRLGV